MTTGSAASASGARCRVATFSPSLYRAHWGLECHCDLAGPRGVHHPLPLLARPGSLLASPVYERGRWAVMLVSVMSVHALGMWYPAGYHHGIGWVWACCKEESAGPLSTHGLCSFIPRRHRLRAAATVVARLHDLYAIATPASLPMTRVAHQGSPAARHATACFR
jgi:hypothetical protein